MSDPKVDLVNVSHYQTVYVGDVVVRKGGRTDKRLRLIDWKRFKGKSVLDLGCNNGMLSIEAKKWGARQVIGVDHDPAVLFAKKLAEQQNLDIDFWQVDIESPEFIEFCPPRFDFVFFCAMIRHMHDKKKMWRFIDTHTRNTLYFESNFEQRKEPVLESIQKNTSFLGVKCLGESEERTKKRPDEGSYFMFKCSRDRHAASGAYDKLPVVWLPVHEIKIGRKVADFKKLGEKVWEGQRRKVDRLKVSIKSIGLVEPLLVAQRAKDWHIKEGGHRLLAMQELNDEEGLYPFAPSKIVE